MNMSIKEAIRATFSSVFSEQVEGYQLPIINDDLVLLESGLDSMGFAVLVVELEEVLGFDPFSISEDAFYEKNEPK